MEILTPNKLMCDKLKGSDHLHDQPWPCLNVMKRVKIIIIIMALCAFFVFCFFSYLNYQVNLSTLIETKKISEFVQGLDTVDIGDLEAQGGEEIDSIECCKS